MQDETRTQLQKEGEASKQEIALLTERLSMQAKRVSAHTQAVESCTILLWV